MEEDIIIRKYVKSDYDDIAEAGYFNYFYDSYLPQSLDIRLKHAIDRKEIEKMVLKQVILNREEIILVAHSRKDRKIVGTIKLRKITDSLWGLWHIFVSPSYRGRRIAELLYQDAFKLLKEKKVEKVVGAVSTENVASVKSARFGRTWDDFLPTRIFNIGFNIGKNVKTLKYMPKEDIKLREFHGEKEELFQIFMNCVGKRFCSVLEIDRSNFLDRIFGSGYIESMESNFLTKLIMRKNIIVAECEGKITGYGISIARRFLPPYHVLHLFADISENLNVCKVLLAYDLAKSVYGNKSKFVGIYKGGSEAENRLTKAGLEVKQSLITYKFIQ
jgi:GNAT superfamily N-acetyltransferase